MNTLSERVAGSFRDPSGQVYLLNGRIFRTVTAVAQTDYLWSVESGAAKTLEEEGWLIRSEEVARDTLGIDDPEVKTVLEHPRVPFVSYPYEWSFSMLKAAALHQLGFHLRALELGGTLSDASAYNIQFIGPNPLFIDRLSLVRYEEGAFWEGHRQFCMQYLNPLLLWSRFQLIPNEWYRGTLEGIPSDQIARILPWYAKFRPNILKHVVLPSMMGKASVESVASAVEKKDDKVQVPLPKAQLVKMLQGLKSWIEGMQTSGSKNSTWGDYKEQHCYEEDEHATKKAFVHDFCQAVKPKQLWDIGCNTGEFSEIALKAGSEYVVGFDFDHGALHGAYNRATANKLKLLPLFLDAANPPSDQGWMEQERRGLIGRAPADALLALALIHHLAIGRNIPLDQLIGWLTTLAPRGIIEFIPPQDPKLKLMLATRKNIFTDYSEENFLNSLKKHAKIVKTQTTTKGGRLLAWYETASPA